MPGPAKDNLRNNAGVVLSKQEGKDSQTKTKYIPAAIPRPSEEQETVNFLHQVRKEIEDLRTEVGNLRARVDKLQIAGAGGDVTL